MKLLELYNWFCEAVESRDPCIQKFREQKYLTTMRRWNGWSRHCYDHAERPVTIYGFHHESSLRRVILPDNDYLSYDTFLRAIGEGELLLVVHAGEHTSVVPFEWVEGLYEDCYRSVDQWWRCDGDGRRVEGHRWQSPLIRGRRYSEGYKEAHFETCVVTGECMPRCDLTMTPDGYMCQSALQDSKYRTCTSCGNIAHNSSFIRLCEQCGTIQEDHSKERDYVSGYHDCNHWKAIRLSHETEEHDLLGCELEVDCGEGSDASEVAYQDLRSYDCVADIQSDGSLQEGFEVITHPCTHGYLKVNMGDLLTDAVYYQDYDNHHKAGFHVHVSRSSLPGVSDCKKLDYFVHKYKEQVCEIANRRSDEWARFTKDPSNGIHGDSFGTSHTRYSAINFENSRTVEFRVFSQPTTKRRLQIYLDFVQSLVEFVRMSDVIDGDAWGKYSRYVKANKARFDVLATVTIIEKETEQHVYCDS